MLMCRPSVRPPVRKSPPLRSLLPCVANVRWKGCGNARKRHPAYTILVISGSGGKLENLIYKLFVGIFPS